MTFVDDDEISKINAEKMAKIAKDAKSHKPSAKEDTAKVKPQPRPFPPVLAINAIVGEIYEESFPLITDPSKGISQWTPQPVPVQKILDSLMVQYRTNFEKSGKELPESLAKGFALNLLNELREIALFGLIVVNTVDVDGVKGEYTYITPKGIIYANSLNYLAGNDPREHYAIYLQVSSS